MAEGVSGGINLELSPEREKALDDYWAERAKKYAERKSAKAKEEKSSTQSASGSTEAATSGQ